MDNSVPPALARLQHMNQDVISGRNALTPVLNRDDAMKEWERRQQGGKAAPAQTYPQLEFLQQQAELAAASGLTTWVSHSGAAGVGAGGGRGGGAAYQPATGSGLAHQYHPSQTSIVVDEERRDQIMSNVRASARAGGDGTSVGSSAYGPPSSAGVISSPPQAYTSNATTAGNRYAAAYGGQPPQQQSSQHQPHPSQQQQQGSQPASQQHSPTSPFDSLERRQDMAGMYVPMQPDHQYQAAYGGTAGVGAGRWGMGVGVGVGGGVAQPPQALAAGFYGPGVVPAGAGQQGQGQGGGFSGPGAAGTMGKKKKEQ